MQTELTGVPTTCKATTGHGAAPSAHSGYRPPKARKLTSALTLYLGVGGQDCDTDIPQGEHGWTEVTGQVCDKLVRVTEHRPQPSAGGRIFPHVPSSPCEETAAGPWVALTLLGLYPDLPRLTASRRTDAPRQGKSFVCTGRAPHLLRQSVSVVVPDAWLSPFTTLPSLPGLSGQNGVEEPGRSRLMSQKGSIVVETPL